MESSLNHTPSRVTGSRLRILVVNWRCIQHPRAGGAEIHMHRLFSILARHGHTIRILTCGAPGLPSNTQVDGVQYFRVGDEYSFLFRWRKAFAQLIQQFPFDLVVDDISKIPLGVSRFTSLPVIGICHHVHGPTLFQELRFPIAQIVHRLEQRIKSLYRDTPILAVSDSTRQELIQMGLNTESVGIVHNGIDDDVILNGPKQRQDPPLLVYLGRLVKYKNIECILRAFTRIHRQIPQAQLLIVGSGNHEDRLKQYHRKLDCPSVEFVGQVSDDRKKDILRQAWLLMAASMKEGWGISILEANACGVPAVASDVPGFRDSIQNGITGMLYPYDNDSILAQQVVELIHNESRWNTFSQNARQWAKRFSWETTAEQLLGAVHRYYPKL